MEDYIPPFALLVVGLILGVLFGEESPIGVLAGGLFAWGFFWTIRVWCEHGEALRYLRERDRVDRMARLVEDLEHDRRP